MSRAERAALQKAIDAGNVASSRLETGEQLAPEVKRSLLVQASAGQQAIERLIAGTIHFAFGYANNRRFLRELAGVEFEDAFLAAVVGLSDACKTVRAGSHLRTHLARGMQVEVGKLVREEVRLGFPPSAADRIDRYVNARRAFAERGIKTRKQSDLGKVMAVSAHKRRTGPQWAAP